jgi:hypothetical protein
MEPWQTSLNKIWNRRGKEGTKREDQKWSQRGKGTNHVPNGMKVQG